MRHEVYIQRCIELALKGGLNTRTNPMVGALLVHNGRIIGEGWHEKYGGPHAEVNAVKSVAIADQPYIRDSILYVSLEPCCVEGKTPACTQLILREGIRKVVIGSVDPDARMQGKGIQLLTENGVEVSHGICKEKCEELIRKFKTNLGGMPYVMLKWACTLDQVMGMKGETLAITGKEAQWYTHKWRSEFDGILVGKNTILTDKPQLNNRLFPGPSPVRIVLDSKLEIPEIMMRNENAATLVVNQVKDEKNEGLTYVKVNSTRDWQEVYQKLFDHQIYSVMVEGGSQILHSIIESGLWQEARILRSQIKLKEAHNQREWILAPEIKGKLISSTKIDEQTTAFVMSHEV